MTGVVLAEGAESGAAAAAPRHADPAAAAPPEGRAAPPVDPEQRVLLFEKLSRARFVVQQEEQRQRLRVQRWATWPGHQREFDAALVPRMGGLYVSSCKLDRAGAVATLRVADNGEYTFTDPTGKVADQRCAAGVISGARLLRPPSAAWAAATPAALQVTVDEGRASTSGVYHLVPDARHNGMPQWRRSLGADRPALLLITDRLGQWALTTEDRVADGRNFMVSRRHEGALPHRLTAPSDWGKIRQGGLDPVPFRAEALPPPHLGAEVEVRSPLSPDVHGQGGRVVARDGDLWRVRFAASGLGERPFPPDLLRVTRPAPPPARVYLATAAGFGFIVERPAAETLHGILDDFPFAPELQPDPNTFAMLAQAADAKKQQRAAMAAAAAGAAACS